MAVDIWTWLVSIFAAMGSFFTANWSDVRDWVSSWWTGLSEFLSQPGMFCSKRSTSTYGDITFLKIFTPY